MHIVSKRGGDGDGMNVGDGEAVGWF